MNKENENDQKIVKGTVERILSERGGWGLLLIRTHKGEEIKLMGNVLPVPPQSECKFFGKWEKQDPRYGQGMIFKADSVEIEMASSVQGIIKKLEEMPNIGPRRAKTIIKTLDEENNKSPEDILDKIIDNPLQLCSIPGISEERALRIKEEALLWKEDSERFKIDVKLLQVLPKWIKSKLIKKYPLVKKPGDNRESAIEVLKDDPYRLTELRGVGFKKADQVALTLGIPQDDQRRRFAAVDYLLGQSASNEGHTWITFDQILKWSHHERIQGISNDQEKLKKTILEGEEKEAFIVKENFEKIASLPFYGAETIIAQQAIKLSQEKPITATEQDVINNLADELTLNEEQKNALVASLKYNFLIITGGPGVGKTYTVNAIVKALNKIYPPTYSDQEPVAMCAPTGKAARRMQELTKSKARTIHQTLGFSFDTEGFKHGLGNPLPHDVIICDEASMLESLLASQLFAAVASWSKLILVGDVDQLPSVGAGNVLSDLISSDMIPVVRLKKIMRQSDDSAIILNSHKLINGISPLIDNDKYKDFKFFEIDPRENKQEERLETLEEIIEWYELIREKYPNLKERDVQILSPQKNGELGVFKINEEIRALVNPDHPSKPEIIVSYGKTVDEDGNEIPEIKKSFRVNDRIINTKNNYDLEVMNGEMGTIKQIIFDPTQPQNHKKAATMVEMDDGKIVSFQHKDLTHLLHSYAITIHKSQGSEWPVVIIPVSTSHYHMLSRRLLYTAITRSKKLMVLVGTKKAINNARKNIKDASRQTWLKELLLDEKTKPEGQTSKTLDPDEKARISFFDDLPEKQKTTPKNYKKPIDYDKEDIPF